MWDVVVMPALIHCDDMMVDVVMGTVSSFIAWCRVAARYATYVGGPMNGQMEHHHVTSHTQPHEKHHTY